MLVSVTITYSTLLSDLLIEEKQTMPVFISLLRAVNVGGTGKLPMSDLKALCNDAGLASVQTYIASGNVVFKSRKKAATIKAELESRLEAYAGKPVGVLMRTVAEMQSILNANPYPHAKPNHTVALFLDRKAKQSDIDDVTGAKNEELSLGSKEIYVHYPQRNGRHETKNTCS